MSEDYRDRSEWSDSELLLKLKDLVCSTYTDANNKEVDVVNTEILRRMQPQNDEWEDVTLGDNELLQKGDLFHWSLCGKPDQEVYEHNIGRRVGEFTCPKITRRVRKEKPYSDHESEARDTFAWMKWMKENLVDTTNDLPKIAICPACGTAIGIEGEEPYEKQCVKRPCRNQRNPQQERGAS